MNAAKPRMLCRPCPLAVSHRWLSLLARPSPSHPLSFRFWPYCANIAASCLWQCVLLLLHSSRRALHIFNASHKMGRAVSSNWSCMCICIWSQSWCCNVRSSCRLSRPLFSSLGQLIFSILRLSRAHGVRQMTVEMIARRIEGVWLWAWHWVWVHLYVSVCARVWVCSWGQLRN